MCIWKRESELERIFAEEAPLFIDQIRTESIEGMYDMFYLIQFKCNDSRSSIDTIYANFVPRIIY